jgi:hypothetical protein
LLAFALRNLERRTGVGLGVPWERPSEVPWGRPFVTSPLGRPTSSYDRPNTEQQNPTVGFHVIYRSTGRENRKRRPSFYSKLACLASFLRAFERCSDAEVIFLNDGEIPSERLAAMKATGEVVAIRQAPEPEKQSIGFLLYRSNMSALQLVDERKWPGSDLVYFAEDDYLYLPEAFDRLIEAAALLRQASYLAFYASILWNRSRGYWVNDELWQTAEGTTSTFGARIDALRADRLIHRLAFKVGFDTDVCLAYQGIAPFRWSHIFGELLYGAPVNRRPFLARVRSGCGKALVNLLAARAALRPHLLVAPYRPLATHVELPYLATGVDWEAVARESARWLEENQGIPTDLSY